VQRRLRPIDVDELIKLYTAGSEVTELLERFGVHRATVFEILNRKRESIGTHAVSPPIG
jgi:transposase